jgi:triacylglycerol lipase
MPITDSQAVPYGLLVMYAEDMYSAKAANTLAPPLDDRIANAGWTVRATITAEDKVALLIRDPKRRREFSQFSGKRVFFGFVAQNKADPDAYAVVIRGTEGVIEWIIDAQFAPMAHPQHPDTRVEHGFWDIFDTMQLADLTGQTTNPRATAGVAALVGPRGRVVVAGHSLGSSLATYFVEELAEIIGERASACMFASPRTGDRAWATLFDATVKDYRLFNYVIDVVTHVPTGLGYVTLSKAARIEPGSAQAGIKVGLGCNHHVICYCAMLDLAQTEPNTHDPRDQSCAQCILGGRETVTAEARALASSVRVLQTVSDKAAEMLLSHFRG